MPERPRTIQNLKISSAIRRRWRRAPIALAVVLVLALAAGRAEAGIIPVGVGGNLQAAINAAQPGDIIVLQAATTFVGNFVLPVKPGAQFITIRTAVDDSVLPGPDQRIGPQHEGLLATLRSPNALPVLRTAPGAHHWQLVGVRILGGGGSADIITLGSGSTQQNDYGQVPQHLVLDRVIIRGDPARGQKRAIALNSGTTTIRNSHIADIILGSQETQAIAGWNGPGPYLVENNYLEAAGVNILFGGAEPFIPGLVPSDIVIRRNHMTKQLAWRNVPQSVKNLLELKNARRVLIEGNVLEHNWVDAQNGYAVLFTVRSPSVRATWTTIEQVTFQNNIVRRSAAGINVLGHDANRTQQTRGILIRNNLFSEIDHNVWGGSGTFLQVGDAPADITVEHNTIIQSGNLVTAYGGSATSPMPIVGFRLANNIGLHNTYGIFGTGKGVGNGAITAYFPGGVIVRNVLAGGQANLYPPSNLFPAPPELMAQFVNPAAGAYDLQPSSPLRGVGTDGGDLGVNFDELNRAISGGACDPAHLTPPLPPTGHVVQTVGTQVMVSWQPTTGATSYILEAGSAPGLANLFNGNVGPATSLATVAPPGHYYTRVRAASACGVSAVSNEVSFVLGAGAGSAPCTGPPPAPTEHTVQTIDLHALLGWRPAAAASSYVLEAGTAPGRADLVVANVGAATSLVATAPPGSYITRVRAINSCGPSAPSNEVAFSLGCAGAPPPPSGLSLARSGSLLTLSWAAAAGATSYQLQAGTTAGATNALDADLGNLTQLQFDARGVPAGAYFVRVRAKNACGISGAASEILVTVP